MNWNEWGSLQGGELKSPPLYRVDVVNEGWVVTYGVPFEGHPLFYPYTAFVPKGCVLTDASVPVGAVQTSYRGLEKRRGLTERPAAVHETMASNDWQPYRKLVSDVWHAFGRNARYVHDALQTSSGFLAVGRIAREDPTQLLEAVSFGNHWSVKVVEDSPERFTGCSLNASIGDSFLTTLLGRMYEHATARALEGRGCIQTPSYTMSASVLEAALFRRDWNCALQLVALTADIDQIMMTSADPTTALRICCEIAAPAEVLGAVLGRGAALFGRPPMLATNTPIELALKQEGRALLHALLEASPGEYLVNTWKDQILPICVERGLEDEATLIRAHVARHTARQILAEELGVLSPPSSV